MSRYDYAREIADACFPSRRLCGLPVNVRPAPTAPEHDEYDPRDEAGDAEEGEE
jgi:hypothetical protein